jgi:hypothetical protein
MFLSIQNDRNRMSIYYAIIHMTQSRIFLNFHQTKPLSLPKRNHWEFHKSKLADKSVVNLIQKNLQNYLCEYQLSCIRCRKSGQQGKEYMKCRKPNKENLQNCLCEYQLSLSGVANPVTDEKSSWSVLKAMSVSHKLSLWIPTQLYPVSRIRSAMKRVYEVYWRQCL